MTASEQSVYNFFADPEGDILLSIIFIIGCIFVLFWVKNFRKGRQKCPICHHYANCHKFHAFGTYTYDPPRWSCEDVSASKIKLNEQGLLELNRTYCRCRISKDAIIQHHDLSRLIEKKSAPVEEPTMLDGIIIK